MARRGPLFLATSRPKAKSHERPFLWSCAAPPSLVFGGQKLEPPLPLTVRFTPPPPDCQTLPALPQELFSVPLFSPLLLLLENICPLKRGSSPIKLSGLFLAPEELGAHRKGPHWSPIGASSRTRLSLWPLRAPTLVCRLECGRPVEPAAEVHALEGVLRESPRESGPAQVLIAVQ